MARLSRYLLGLFSLEALALFGVAAFLLFLIQCLRVFDVVSDKGQGILTLLGQAMLGMPALGIVFLYVCLGIGLGRALRGLQASSQLQIVHAEGLLPALMRAALLYATAGALMVMLLSHVIDPVSVRTTNDWTASIAADLVSRSMIPHKFVDIVPDVSVVIGSRDSQGNITDFFADDHREAGTRHTYFAKAAIITRDEQGYVLRLRQGAVQYVTPGQALSQVAFDRYDLPMDSLTSPTEVKDEMAQTSSVELVQQGLSTGKWGRDAVSALLKRSGEGLRVFALVLFVVALAAFPTGRRRGFSIPIELAALGAAFVERAVTSYLPGKGWMQIGTGALLLGAVALLILAVRLRVFRPMRLRRPA